MHIIEKIKNRYLSSIRVFFAFSIMIVLLHFLYRIRTFELMSDAYAGMAGSGLWNYIRNSISHDCSATAFSLVVLLLLIISSGKNTVLKYAGAFFFTELNIFYMLLSIEFFRIYETPFSRDFIRSENFTGIPEMIGSVMSEMSAWFFLSLLSLTMITAAISLLLRNRETGYHLKNTMPYYPPALLAMLVLVSAVVPAHELSAKNAVYPGRKNDMQELATNPLLNLFVKSGKNDERNVHAEGEFSFGYNSKSIENPGIKSGCSLIPRGKKYNVILYMFESFPSKYFNQQAGGRYVTPTWHRLSGNSLFMENHYANYPLSANAMFSILASSYEMNGKDPVIQAHPEIVIQTLPVTLKQNGYRTCLIHTGGLGYAGQNRFLRNRGFDEILEYRHLKDSPPYNIQVGWGLDERSMTRPGINFMKRDKNNPFFIIFQPVNPHHPYAIPDKSFKITGDVPEGADFKTRSWMNYLNSLHYADHCLADLVDSLEREGLMENTLLFLVADHGEAFYQHRRNYNHPLYLYEENVHVPFLIYNRNLFDRRVDFKGITRHIDLMPTILDAIGIKRPATAEGVSILSTGREQMAILHTSWREEILGVRDGRWKYIYNMTAGVQELYDLDSDPDEKTDLSGKKAEIAGRYSDVVKKSISYRDGFFRIMLKKNHER
ncbi:MAG: sulfatase-like hydrolase/transferase [Spirochaetes bacterium]|jgi:arylsulfatase A-like enzyme|nr:sulfatase-like hydrolase/transferase [Spirochaetota bacterium]